jgi:hypothetical protein
MRASSMTEFDEMVNETEIIFSATPEFDEHFNSIPQKQCHRRPRIKMPGQCSR